VLVAASSGFHRRDGAVYRFDGEKFTPCEGLPRFPRTPEARQIEARGEIAVVGGAYGRLFVSEDAGRTFALCADELPVVHAAVIE
jgi:hypothetical protein